MSDENAYPPKPVFVHADGTSGQVEPLMQPAEPQKNGADRWPWHYALIAYFGAFLAASFFQLFAFVFWEAGGGNAEDDKSFLMVASALGQLAFIGTSCFVARLAGPIKLRDFGLVRAPFWPSVAKAGAVMACYLLAFAVYQGLVNLESDDAPNKLGAGDGTVNMIAFAVLVAAMAPLGEELLYRGVVFRALKNGVGVVLGAAISGVLFGVLHIDSLASERLLQVIPLCVLGFAFAIAYWWSGTLFVPIALHATNNSLAVIYFAADEGSTVGIVAGAVVWLSMMAFCIFGHRFTDKGDPDPPPAATPPVAPQAPPPFPTAPPTAPLP